VQTCLLDLPYNRFLEETDINVFPLLVEGKKMNKGERLEDPIVALKVAMSDLLNRLSGED